MSTTRTAPTHIVLASASVLALCLAPVPAPAQAPATAAQATRARVQVPTVPMPNLVGQSYKAALQDPVVTKFKIGLATQDMPSTGRPAGTIVRQEPPAGSPIRPGASATVFVATAARLPDRATRIPDPQIVRPDPVRPLPVVRVPKVEGLSEGQAAADLAGGKFVVERSYEPNTDRRPGTVVAQRPAAGTLVRPGSSVLITVARAVEQPPITMPNLIGSFYEEALRDRRVAQLELQLARRDVVSAAQPPGVILRTVPGPGEPVRPGATVPAFVAAAGAPPPKPPDGVAVGPPGPGRPARPDLPPADPPKGPGPVVPPVTPQPVLARMPDLVGRPFTSALRHPEVLEARLRLDQQFDATAAGLPGTIVRQAVPAGTGVEVGRSVSVLVATGVAVPLVTRQPSAVAERQIAAAGLRPAVSNVTSDLEPGTVVNQTPAAGVMVSRGASVAIAVAVPEKVTVPDLVGRTRDEATQELARLKLRLDATDDAVSTAPPGRVATQQPPAGVETVVGAAVRIGVATGVEVPSLTGLSADEAARAVVQRGLSFEDADVATDQAPPGRVFSQQPQAGTVLARGSRVRVALAVAPPVEVPDVRGLARAEAERVLRARRLTARFSDDAASTQEPDSVVSQSPGAGATARVGAVVSLTVATGVVVPDVVRQTRDRATAVAQGAGLTIGLQSVSDAGAAAGVVVRQDPPADTRVARGTTLTLFLPLAQIPVAMVPDLRGRPRAEAERLLVAAGLVARVTEAGSTAPAGTVVTQRPAANTQVAPASLVDVEVARAVVVPATGPPPPPLVPVWLTPLLVVVTLVGLSALTWARSERSRGRSGRTAQATTPNVELEPEEGEHSIRLEVFGRSLVDLEVRVRATVDPGEQSLQVSQQEVLIADERRIYE